MSPTQKFVKVCHARITIKQRDHLVKFMAERHNANLQRNELNNAAPLDVELHINEWYQLGTELNRLGVPKSGEGWFICWRNLKFKTKQKFSDDADQSGQDRTDRMIMDIINGRKVSFQRKPGDEFANIVDALIDDSNIEKTPELTGHFVHPDALIDDCKSETILDQLSSSSSTTTTAADASAEATAKPSISSDKQPRHQQRIEQMQTQLMQSFEQTVPFDRERCGLLKDRNALLRTMLQRTEVYHNEVSAHCRGIEEHNREMRELKRRKLEFLRSKLQRES